MKKAGNQKIFWQANLATLVAATAIALWSGPATAYMTADRAADCWQRVAAAFPANTMMFLNPDKMRLPSE